MESTITLELDGQLVADIVTQDPRSATVFERHGIEYCCGGRVPLRDACRERGLDLAVVLAELEQATADRTDARDWRDAPIDELVDEIIHTHHDYARIALPRLQQLAEKVARAHGSARPELVEAKQVVDELVVELTAHVLDEEDVVFPACLHVAAGYSDDSLAPRIARLEHEHDDAASHLSRLRALLDDFVPPAGACTSWRAYLDALARFEQDLHRHVHKENHILFPRVARELERIGAD